MLKNYRDFSQRQQESDRIQSEIHRNVVWLSPPSYILGYFLDIHPFPNYLQMLRVKLQPEGIEVVQGCVVLKKNFIIT